MNHSPEIQFQLVPRAELTEAQKAEMLQLMTGHFEGVTPGQFASDLAGKNLVLMLTRHEALVGFSTLRAYATTVGEQVVNVIYSGDTIVAPAAWGTTALPRAWVAGVEALHATLPPAPCFWLLLVSGFRTYRFLPVFWREFFPRFDKDTPPDKQHLIDQLARELFGAEFEARQGLVHFKHSQRLRAGLNGIPPGRERDPHVAFFVSRNPGHQNGDELVCLAELCSENLTRAGRRMINSRNRATFIDHS